MVTLLSIFSVVFIILNTTSALPDSTKSDICGNKDIRNEVKNLNELRGCRIIEGFLMITLVDKYSETDYDAMDFPELTEVTDFVLLYRVNGLKSLSKMFPNLRIIRGNNLIHGNSLIVYEMENLQEIGLKSLLKVFRGSVRIEKNPSLCFVETIDWSRIISENEGNVIRDNKPANECPSCPISVSGQSSLNNMSVVCPETALNKGLCWNQNECQQICPPECGNLTCNANGECCDKSCIGCANNNRAECLSCRYIGNGNARQCVKKCPANTFELDNNRCVTEEECYRTKRPYFLMYDTPLLKRPYMARDDGVCSYKCPTNYYPVGPSGRRRCEKCGENGCRRDCPPGIIDSISSARRYRGCTHIKGSFVINIRNQGGHNIERELETTLGNIEVIEGNLSIVRSFPLMSLGFFKKLRAVKGETGGIDRFGLKVLENPNLEALFLQNVTIEHGRLFFHFNPKLCMKVIEEFKRNVVDLRDIEKLPEDEVAPNTNGDRTACDVEPLTVNMTKISYNVAILEMKPIAYDDERQLLGYILYYKPALFKNVSMFDGRDACGNDGWTLDDIPDNYRNSTSIAHILTQLKPNTQYAYYVRTHTVASEQRGGLSEIQYFTTLSEPTGDSEDTIEFEDVLHNTVYVKVDVGEDDEN